MIVLKNILVATDFSEPAAAAMDYGRALGRQFGSQLYVIHVVEDILMSVGSDGYVAEVSQLQIDAEEKAKERMRALVDDRDREELRPKGYVFHDRSIPRGIAEYARTHAIDLIVLGTHGRTGVRHLALGSVAERVVRAAPCPVLTVKHPEREFVTVPAAADRPEAAQPGA
jgi:nucleotide-binding universal stress UspA family protein